jgi:two-component system, OmpR family, sensor histidine kinase KdpD
MQGVQTPSDLDLLPRAYSAGLRQMRNSQHAGAGRIDSPNCLTLIALRPARCGMGVSAANRTIRLASGAGLGSAAVLLVSYCSFRFHFNLPTAGFVDLLIVVVTALNFGFFEATGSSLVAVACLDYFFAPPIHSFHVDDPENWVALVAFEIIALIVSRLSNQLRDQMRQSLLHRQNTEKLYELSRSILVLNRQQPAGPQIASLIMKHIGIDGVAIFDCSLAEMYSAGACTKEDEDLARTTYLLNVSHDTRESHKWQRVLRFASNPIGAIVISGIGLNSLVVDSIASLVAAAFERARSLEKESRAEAARQTEQLRTTVLDGLAHAFKTPLTVILTSTSGLFEMKSLSPSQSQLIALIDEHATQLNALTSHLLQMAKLESKEIRLRHEEVVIGPFIKQVVDDCIDQFCGHAVQLSIEDEDLSVSGDRQLLAITITELLVNAAKYSSADSPIAVSARNEDGRILISIHNNGPAIDLAERELIFDRFYRSPTTKHRASGSGIGLSVAKRTAEAHQGRMWVDSSPEIGTTFVLSLPALLRSQYADLTE